MATLKRPKGMSAEEYKAYQEYAALIAAYNERNPQTPLKARGPTEWVILHREKRAGGQLPLHKDKAHA